MCDYECSALSQRLGLNASKEYFGSLSRVFLLPPLPGAATDRYGGSAQVGGGRVQAVCIGRGGEPRQPSPQQLECAPPVGATPLDRTRRHKSLIMPQGKGRVSGGLNPRRARSLLWAGPGWAVGASRGCPPGTVSQGDLLLPAPGGASLGGLTSAVATSAPELYRNGKRRGEVSSAPRPLEKWG